MLVVKFDFDSDIRRFRLEKVEFDHIKELVTSNYDVHEFDIRYQDEDGDWCTLRPETMEDFIEVTRPATKAVRLQVIATHKAKHPKPNPKEDCQAQQPLPKSKEDYQAHWKAQKEQWMAHKEEMKQAHKAQKEAWKNEREAAGEQCDWKASKEQWKQCKQDWQQQCRAQKEEWQQAKRAAWEAWHAQKDAGCPLGPLPLAGMMNGLHEAGLLTAEMAASVCQQFLPMIKQRVIKKAAKINNCIPAHIDFIAPVLQALIPHMERLAELRQFVPAFTSAAAKEKLDNFGETLSEFLGAFEKLATDEQSTMLQVAFSELLSKFEGLQNFIMELFPRLACRNRPQFVGMEHHGVVCDACGMKPIVGPRYKCEQCEDYDLCGNCFSKRMEVHDAAHTFECHLTFDRPHWGRHAHGHHGHHHGHHGWWGGKGKGGKGKGGKGMWGHGPHHSGWWSQWANQWANATSASTAAWQMPECVRQQQQQQHAAAAAAARPAFHPEVEPTPRPSEQHPEVEPTPRPSGESASSTPQNCDALTALLQQVGPVIQQMAPSLLAGHGPDLGRNFLGALFQQQQQQQQQQPQQAEAEVPAKQAESAQPAKQVDDLEPAKQVEDQEPAKQVEDQEPAKQVDESMEQVDESAWQQVDESSMQVESAKPVELTLDADTERKIELLTEMGFGNRQLNIELLHAHSGDMKGVLGALLGA